MRTVKLWDYSKPIKARHAGPCGPYYFQTCDLPGTPGGDWKPDARGGFSGYLSKCETEINEGSRARLRVVDAREFYPHAETYCAGEWSDNEFRPIIARLPPGRGFLAGWTMGAGMLTSFDCEIHATEREAARAADAEAQAAAEREHECLERDAEARRLDSEIEAERERIESATDELCESRSVAIDALRAMRSIGNAAGLGAYDALHWAMSKAHKQGRAAVAAIRDAREVLEELTAARAALRDV